MKKFILIFFLSLFLFLVAPFHIFSVNAATLKFVPETVTAAIGDTVEVTVEVDPGADEVKGAEAYILFDTKILEFQSIADGGLFELFQKDTQAGKVYMAGASQSESKVVTTSGTLGIITFKALTDGTVNLNFSCETGKQSSSIIKNDKNNTNIIECTSNGKEEIIIGTGQNANPTEGPLTTTPTVQPSVKTPKELPKTGVFDNVVKFAVPGLIFFFIGTVARVLL